MHHGSHTDSYDEQHMITMDAEQRDSGDTDGLSLHKNLATVRHTCEVFVV